MSLAFKRSSKIDVLLLAMVMLAGWVVIPQSEKIGDWFHAQRYTPPANISQLAQDAGMSSEGRRLFYRFSPVIADDSTLLSECGSQGHGCIKGRHIFISSDDLKNQYSQATVTAAHEMLHVVYERLSKDDRQRVNQLINQQLAGRDGPQVRRKLATYPTTEFYNEAHSFIGSEISELLPELEQHYQPFFIDRSKSTRAYQSAN